ncbi:hypothetical protein GIY23_04030 [Allosaccharopolyspora coralli]|uniref:DNA primase n=1 Tax=Allosaccharopolyspora coralli TaxID=2665642 RepID=A0A5Q3Q6M6_9PSEU|nr:hypothetical protein [Allosaccharopolyspora coralli]QGK68824.1 hypothetical protein GIY23_04030 [Allosaccharopolyspora coralli]
MARTTRGIKAAGAVAGAVLALTVATGCDDVMPAPEDQEQEQQDGGGQDGGGQDGGGQEGDDGGGQGGGEDEGDDG